MSLIERIGRYRAERVIGSGAFATVWLAHDELLDVPVAVKVLADNWSAHLDVRARFLTEAKLLRQADSDRVLRVLDIGELPDGRPYFVTSYADGGSLADRLDAGELPLDEALRVLVQVCESVCVLHEMGVVHRDLKPSNVLFKTDNAGRERLLVADLGIAKALAQGSGLTIVAGSPGYMAPEQARQGGIVDERSDVYGLGAMGYRLLTGRTVKQEPVVSPPGRAGHAVLRALEEDPGRRWPSARALADELTECARGESRTMAAAVAGRASTTRLLPVVPSRAPNQAVNQSPNQSPSQSVATGPPTQRLPALPAVAEGAEPAAGPVPRRRAALVWIVAAVALLAVIAGVALFVAERADVGSPPPTRGGVAPVVATIDVADGANDIAFDAAGDRAFVSNATGQQVSVIDTGSNRVVQVIRLDRYISDIVVSPDGQTVYVTNPASDAVLVISVATGAVTSTIPVGDSPSDIVQVAPDQMWVTNRQSGTVSVIDTAQNVVTATIKVGDQPAGMALGRDGKTVYVANGGNSTVSIIDVVTSRVTKTVATGGGGPVDVLVSAERSDYYLANIQAGTVTVLDAGDNSVRATVPLGGQPLRLAAQGGRVFVTNGQTNTVAVISADAELIGTQPVGDRPIGIAIAPDGRHAYVTNADSKTVSVLDIAAR